MANARDIQRRIKSIKSTKKITRAMEMVSAAKMRKAVEAVLRTRTYANLSWSTILNLSQARNGNGSELHPLLTKRESIKKIGMVLITSNRGLCGGFNTAIISKANDSIRKYQMIGDNVVIDTEFVLMGKKGSAIHQFGHKITADFPKLDLAGAVKEIIPVAQMMVKKYLAGDYDKVMVAYTDFVNITKQEPRVKQLLPVDISAEEEHLGIIGDDARIGIDKNLIDEKRKKHLTEGKFDYEYTFEPNPREVLDEMIPRLIEVQLYQALLESNASEHSARMTAMHQATDAAGDMTDELTRYYNKVRQSSITAEIAEISAGAEVLRK